MLREKEHFLTSNLLCPFTSVKSLRLLLGSMVDSYTCVFLRSMSQNRSPSFLLRHAPIILDTSARLFNPNVSSCLVSIPVHSRLSNCCLASPLPSVLCQSPYPSPFPVLSVCFLLLLLRPRAYSFQILVRQQSPSCISPSALYLLLRPLPNV